MRMKCDVEVITGFIGSGKTSFLNGLLENTLVNEEKVLILLMENGETNIEEKFLKNKKITSVIFNCDKPINEDVFENLLKKYNPHRVIIEFNGTDDIRNLLQIIHSKKNRSLCNLTTVFYVADASTCELYLYNMGHMLMPCFQISNLLVLNNVENLNKNDIEKLRKNIYKLKPKVNILEVKNLKRIDETMKNSKLFHCGIMKKMDIHLRDLISKL